MLWMDPGAQATNKVCHATAVGHVFDYTRRRGGRWKLKRPPLGQEGETRVLDTLDPQCTIKKDPSS